LWLSCLGSENWELAHKFEQAKQLIDQSEANGLIYYAFANRGIQDAGVKRRQSEWADILCFCKKEISGSPNEVR